MRNTFRERDGYALSENFSVVQHKRNLLVILWRYVRRVRRMQGHWTKSLYVTYVALMRSIATSCAKRGYSIPATRASNEDLSQREKDQLEILVKPAKNIHKLKQKFHVSTCV